jgi:hypothetical protein
VYSRKGSLRPVYLSNANASRHWPAYLLEVHYHPRSWSDTSLASPQQCFPNIFFSCASGARDLATCPFCGTVDYQLPRFACITGHCTSIRACGLSGWCGSVCEARADGGKSCWSIAACCIRSCRLRGRIRYVPRRSGKRPRKHRPRQAIQLRPWPADSFAHCGLQPLP